MKLAIMTISYDYFDYDGKYHKPVTTVIDGALDAWNFYQSEKAKDYDYGDSYRETHIDRLPRDYGCAKSTHHIHGQRFGHKPTVEEKLMRAWEDANAAWKEHKTDDALQKKAEDAFIAICEYQDSQREYLGYDPEDEDLFPELEECLPF